MSGFCCFAAWTYFLKILSMQEIVICSWVWLEKTWLLGLFSIFRYDKYWQSISPHCFAIIIRRDLFPFPMRVIRTWFFCFCMSRTLKSQISCALAPLAYMKFRRTLSRLPVYFLSSGICSRTVTSFKENTVRGPDFCFFTGIFFKLCMNTDAASRSWFCAYAANDDKAASRWLRVEAVHPLSSSSLWSG